MPENETPTIRQDILNFARGFCMGAADSVPGVSGGTVALVLGYYHRLVTAISRFNRKALSLAIRRDVRGLVEHLDLRFLMTLGSGVAVALVTLASLMHWLLENRMPETLAVFMGLLLASVWIVARQIEHWTPGTLIALVLAGVAGYIISSLSPIASEPNLPYLFFTAFVAITAMILPGISGSFILVLLGVYHHVTGLIKGLPRGQVSGDILLQIIVFVAGCAIGLMVFTRLLRWLLEHHRNVTFGALLGLMIGSLKRVWPLQLPTAETADEKFSHRIFEFVSIADWPTPTWHLITLTLAALVFVIVIELVAGRASVTAANEV